MDRKRKTLVAAPNGGLFRWQFEFGTRRRTTTCLSPFCESKTLPQIESSCALRKSASEKDLHILGMLATGSVYSYFYWYGLVEATPRATPSPDTQDRSVFRMYFGVAFKLCFRTLTDADPQIAEPIQVVWLFLTSLLTTRRRRGLSALMGVQAGAPVSENVALELNYHQFPQGGSIISRIKTHARTPGLGDWPANNGFAHGYVLPFPTKSLPRKVLIQWRKTVNQPNRT